MDIPHHYSMAKIFKNILAALACIYLFSFNAFAADIHSIPHQTIGYANFEDAFPYGFIKLYEMHFLNVPDYLIEYHKKVGGTVTFTTEDLNRGKFGNSNILGLYNIETHKIEIKLDPFEILEQEKDAYSTPAHEYGHFLYHITKDTWTEDMYDALHDEFVKRSKTNSTVVNQDEAFAQAYADYVIMPQLVNYDMQQTFKKCLDRVKTLNGGGTDSWVDIYPAPSTLTAPGTVVYK